MNLARIEHTKTNLKNKPHQNLIDLILNFRKIEDIGKMRILGD
jgi:hypothetical protein